MCYRQTRNSIDLSRVSGALRVPSQVPPLTVQLPAIHHSHYHRHPPWALLTCLVQPQPRCDSTHNRISDPMSMRISYISAPGLVLGTLVFFIVPGCALDTEKMADENIAHRGLTYAEDNASKLIDVSQLPTDFTSVLRKLVGSHFMHETACVYLLQRCKRMTMTKPHHCLSDKGGRSRPRRNWFSSRSQIN
jgi:hypothetical protein